MIECRPPCPSGDDSSSVPNDPVRAALARHGIEVPGRVPIPCILCRRPTRNRGVWLPDDPVQQGLRTVAPRGRFAIIYPVCDAHCPDPQTLGRIERLIIRMRTSSAQARCGHA